VSFNLSNDKIIGSNIFKKQYTSIQLKYLIVPEGQDIYRILNQNEFSAVGTRHKNLNWMTLIQLIKK
jgi:hypothetical protein